MAIYSIDSFDVEKQVSLLWEYELKRFRSFQGDEIFCPMCEDAHANNTNCQRND